jgi:hypothetical protein
MRRIEKEWQSLCNDYEPTTTQDAYDKMLKARHILLGNKLSHDDFQQLAATASTLPVRGIDRSEFTNDVIEYMTIRFIDLGDRESLVKLLSTRCIDRVYYSSIEHYLVLRGKKLKDPILIIGDAFSQCTDPEIRHHLALIVRRSFAGSMIHGKDDADFVKNAMEWYKTLKDSLNINERYAIDEVKWGAMSYDDNPERYNEIPLSLYGKHPPLFVEKSEQ